MSLETQFFLLEDGLKMPLMDLPLRCSAIKTSKGTVVISATKNISENREKILALGEVSAIVAPNLFHNLFAGTAKETFPNAKVYAPKGIEKRCPTLKVDTFLDPATWPFQEELVMIPLGGMPRFLEYVFLHQATKTLFVTDLCFNLGNPHKFLGRLLLDMFGTRGRFGVSRLFKSMIWRRRQFRESIEVLLQHDFSRIVMAHGKVIENKGKFLLTEALKERGLY